MRGMAMAMALVTAGCATQAKETKAEPVAPATAPAEESAASSGGAGPAGKPQAQQAAHPAARVGGPSGIASGATMLPPAAGQSRATFEGCLAAAGTEQEGEKFPARPKTRSMAPPPVTVSASGLGVTVAHELEHACCLKAEVSSAVEGGAVTVTERLLGTPCRCMCSSTIRTAVGLAPGSYELVVVEQGAGGASREVHRQKVEIGRLGPQTREGSPTPPGE
jgi:hypothetical protein